ncbi:MAG: potassium channel protein [Roseiflexus castenholzii]|uniref:ion transporter n=1 Tax=Roseiflexus castenholzii TaxID=120962 RepID=UPI000CC99186|nr:MAG: potassium channel protein [Roseiflexus castenholzii]
MNHARSRIWELVEVSYDSDSHSPVLDWYDTGMMALILLNVLAVVIASVEEIGGRFAWFFSAFEVFSVAIFTVEYIVKLWACTADARYAHPVLGRVKYALTPMVIIDLLAFLPFYLWFFMIDLRFLRALRLFRLLRVLKLGRYSQSLALMAHVFRRKRSDLMAVALVLLVMLVIAASIMYYAEHEAQPEAFSSIPAAMWWGVATFTTIGYGDVYPITPLGRVLGSFIAILGIGIFALPAGILASGFSEEHERMRNECNRNVCPQCGQAIDE